MVLKNYLSYRVTILFIAVLILLGLGATAASAATYYINNQTGSNCNDANVGTSASAPWCNVSNVSSKTLAAGDQILLARGATWNNQTMTFTNSGTSAAHITLGDYGSGNRPKLIGNGTAASRLV